jgi:hypothetical protein
MIYFSKYNAPFPNKVFATSDQIDPGRNTFGFKLVCVDSFYCIAAVSKMALYQVDR